MNIFETSLIYYNIFLFRKFIFTAIIILFFNSFLYFHSKAKLPVLIIEKICKIYCFPFAIDLEDEVITNIQRYIIHFTFIVT